MEFGLEERSATASHSPLPAASPFAASAASPPHTKTQSTLAPTAEFTRIFLLAWIIRYIFRGFSGATFEQRLEQPGMRATILNGLSAPGRVIQKWLGGAHKPGNSLGELEAAAYSLSMGVGSGLLSWQYGAMVKSDMVNLFRESVGEEMGKPQEQVTFNDIKRSDNAIVRRTVENYHSKMRERLGTDALFFLGAPLKSGHITDLLLGGKGIQIFADTWKRKTTLFEDLVTFVNHKINPRNGLGQPVSIGEVFDLYQHYADAFHPDKMFTNVMGGGPGDVDRWAKSQPIFQRLTELMNQTYAYKHTAGGKHAEAHAEGANLALPQLIFLLGHDFIDPDRPAETLAAIEVVNTHGIPAAKQMRAMLQQGQTLAQVKQHFRITDAPVAEATVTDDGPNGVIPKGSTMQLDAAPVATIDAASIAHVPPQASPELSN